MSSVIGKKPTVEYQSKDELLYDIKYYCDEIEKYYDKFLETKGTNEIENKDKDEIFHNVELIERALKKLMNPKRKWITNLRNNEQIRKINNDLMGKKPIRSKIGLLYDIENYCNNIHEDMNSDYNIGYEIGKIKRALKGLGVF